MNSRGGISTLLSAALLGLPLFSATPARAAPAPMSADDTPVSLAELKRLVQRGNSEYALGHFKAAMDLFEEAYRKKPIAGLLYNIAQCHRQLRQFEEAATTYRSFIRLDPASPNVKDAEDLLAEVEAAINVQRHAQTAPPLAGDDLNPSARPPAPAPKIIALKPPPPPPPNNVQLEPLGVANAPKTAVATAPPATTPPAAMLPPVASAERAIPPAASSSARPPAPITSVVAQPAPQRTRVFTWVAGGAGVVALGAGAAFGLSSKSAANEITSMPHSQADLASLQDQQKSRAGLANVCFIAGAALLVGGGILYALHL